MTAQTEKTQQTIQPRVGMAKPSSRWLNSDIIQLSIQWWYDDGRGAGTPASFLDSSLP